MRNIRLRTFVLIPAIVLLAACARPAPMPTPAPTPMPALALTPTPAPSPTAMPPASTLTPTPAPSPTAAPPAPSVEPTPRPEGSPSPTLPNTTTARAELVRALKAIHDPFGIDPAKGCYGLQMPYDEYLRGLRAMTAVLFSHPLTPAFTLAELEAIFEEVVGFDVNFIPGDAGAVLVRLPTNRGYPAGCGSHYAAPDAFHVVDRQGMVWDIGVGGLYRGSWWIDGRWLLLIREKLDSTSGPTGWSLWHVGRAEAGWSKLVRYRFAPAPYDYNPPPALSFVDGFNTMIAELTYWWATDPCPFSAEFAATYEHGDWKARKTYQLVGQDYQLTQTEVLSFPVRLKSTGAAVAVDWQAYCSAKP